MWSAGPCNPFNDRAAHIITREILDRGDFEFVADDFFALYKMVSSHIDTTLRTKWRKQQSPVPHDVQISDRIDDANKERSRKVRRPPFAMSASLTDLLKCFHLPVALIRPSGIVRISLRASPSSNISLSFSWD